jgi:hypothetical protein
VKSALLVTALWLVLVAPSASQAAVHCSYDRGSLVLSIVATGGGEVGIRRKGAAIQVFEQFVGPVSCGPTPVTVTDTDRVKVVLKHRSFASIYLGGGPFAPGATTETDGASEIEFAIAGSTEFGEVIGGPHPDHFQWLKEDGKSGVNLNADEDDDLDVAVVEKSPFFFVAFDGGGGPDLLDTRGNPGPSMFATGGAGDDTIVAGPSGAILEGEQGRDRIFGGAAGDLIDPGPGADVVKARGRDDLVQMRADGSRDRIDCGAGRDGFTNPDPFDRLRSCEIEFSG